MPDNEKPIRVSFHYADGHVEYLDGEAYQTWEREINALISMACARSGKNYMTPYTMKRDEPHTCATCGRGEPCEVDCDEGVVPGVHCPFLHVDNLPDCYCSAWRGK